MIYRLGSYHPTPLSFLVRGSITNSLSSTLLRISIPIDGGLIPECSLWDPLNFRSFRGESWTIHGTRPAIEASSLFLPPFGISFSIVARVSQRNADRVGRRDRYVCGRFAPVDKFDKTRNRSLLTGANRYSDRFIRRIRLVSPWGRPGSSATDIGFSITSALTEISRLRRATGFLLRRSRASIDPPSTEIHGSRFPSILRCETRSRPAAQPSAREQIQS